MPWSPWGYKTFPSPLFLFLVGWHQAGSCRQLIPIQLSKGCGARITNTSLAGKGRLLERRPCPCKQQHSGNKQLRITCSPRLISHAVCQPPQQCQVSSVSETLQPKSSPFHLTHPVFFSCCFSAPVSDWCLVYQLYFYKLEHREMEPAFWTKESERIRFRVDCV